MYKKTNQNANHFSKKLNILTDRIQVGSIAYIKWQKIACVCDKDL
jgi:hypothetical protein